MQVRFAAENVKQPKRRADALRKHRRRRRAAHAEAERPHEQQIERDVEDAAEHQKQQRRDAVADGLHEARFEVIRHRQRNARQNHGQIGQRPFAGVGGNLHRVRQSEAGEQKDGGHHRGAQR